MFTVKELRCIEYSLECRVAELTLEVVMRSCMDESLAVAIVGYESLIKKVQAHITITKHTKLESVA